MDTITEDVALARCRVLAQQAADAGESPVGTVIVLDGAIVGEGREASRSHRDITYHAEVEAIRAAVARCGRDLSSATLYTTHEPCLLCSYVMRHHRIGRVVIERPVPEVGGVTSRHPLLTVTDVSTWGPPPEVRWIECASWPHAGTSIR